MWSKRYLRFEGELTDPNPTLISELELKNRIDIIVFKAKKASFFQYPRLGDLVSCNVVLDLKLISIKIGEIVTSNLFKNLEVGINNKKAEENAMEKVVVKVGNVLWNKIK